MKPNNTKTISPKKRKKPAGGLPASPFFDEYLNMNTCYKQVMTLAGIERFAADMVNWARDDDDALILMDFPMKLGIPIRVFYDWRDRSEVLATSILQAKRFIAHRREKGAIKKQYDLKAVAVRQYQFDDEWDDAEKRHQRLKIEELQNQVSSLVKYIDMTKQTMTEEEYKKTVEGTK